jgi:RNA polymerase sigma-70 factor, ECF subfamily
VDAALQEGAKSEYAIQAAIAALHAKAECAEETDWHQIGALYGHLLRIQPSPVVELNRAVALAMAEGAEMGLGLLHELETRGELSEYYLLPAAQADLLRRLKRWSDAAEAYSRALSQVSNKAEREYLARRLREVRREIERMGEPARS